MFNNINMEVERIMFFVDKMNENQMSNEIILHVKDTHGKQTEDYIYIQQVCQELELTMKSSNIQFLETPYHAICEDGHRRIHLKRKQHVKSFRF